LCRASYRSSTASQVGLELEHVTTLNSFLLNFAHTRNYACGRLRLRPLRGEQGGFSGVFFRELIVQDDVEQRLVNADATVVFDEAEFAKAIHEEADPGAGGADHVGEGSPG
jgi:hypothetical protein